MLVRYPTETSAQPLYAEIARTLQAEISSASPGQPVPTEAELIARFSVSRVTIRQALAQLVNDGLIRRYPGKGSFVAPRKEARAVWNFSSLDDLITMRLNTDFQLLDFEMPATSAADAEPRAALGASEIARIECMRWLEGMPISHSVVHTSIELAKALSVDALPRVPQPCKPLIVVLQERGAVTVSKGVQSLSAEGANKTVAARLWIAPGEPVLVVERRYYDGRARLVHMATTFYRSERGQFQFTFEKGKALIWK